MSRFRAYKAKDNKWYVVTTDTNGLAGGPFNDQSEAQARADRLAVLEAVEAKRTAELAAKAAQHPMNITPGYRSADVEDARGEPAPPGPEFYPPWAQRAIKWNGVPRGQLPPPDWSQTVSPAARHHLPVEPYVPGPAEQSTPVPPGGHPSLSSLLPNPSTWGDIRVRAGMPYSKGPKR